MPRAFVIRPFGTKKDSSGATIDFERTQRELIDCALKAAGLAGGTTGEIIDAGNIREDMFSLIVEADLVLCDITVHNANVFYELGIRHALRKKSLIMLRGTPSADAIPFDLLTDRYLPYPVADPKSASDALCAMLRATLASDRETDSPIFKMLPRLPEVDVAAVQAIPMDYAEEVKRALAAKWAGWLRLLAREVEGQRFEWPALRLVAEAQVRLKDYQDARVSWERVRKNAPDDIAANLALANVYERLYREELKVKRARPELLLELSNQAIARALANTKAGESERSEALALEGRNLKTLWRIGWEGQASQAERRKRATKRSLRKSYETYRRAYLFDLNHYWSGLAALQQGVVMLELARDESWQDIFDDADEALAYKSALQRQVAELRSAIAQAIEGAAARLAADDKDRVWVDLSRADLTFLSEASPSRIVEAYDSAVPSDAMFAWDSARSQLKLFEGLGIKEKVVNDIVAQLDGRMVQRGDGNTESHCVMFAGHRLDEAGRTVPRFPASAEGKARELIRAALAKLKDVGLPVKVLASAAPGADILCHEICETLAIDSTICLPVPNEDFARTVFRDLDAWKSRYLKLVRRRAVLTLSDQLGLPRWLQASGRDPWERGNRWVLEMARASGADSVTLLALWDGRKTGDAPGGTAHMVQIARDAGSIDIVTIDANQLLN